MRGSDMLPGLGRIYEETKRVSRILELIQIINARPNRYRRRDLAARYEISERMIQKDLDVIRNGLKLALGRSAEGYFEEVPRLPAIGFSFAEAVSLLLAVEAGRRNSGIGAADLDGAIERLRGPFPPEFASRVGKLTRPDGAGRPVSGAHRQQMLGLLQRAALEGRKVRIRYSTSSRAGQESVRIVHPYHLLSYVRSWHLVAHCERRGRVLTFKVDRIRKAEPLEDHFVVPRDFSLSEHIGGGWGVMSGKAPDAVDVELLFEPEAGRWVSEEEWHKSQQVEHLPDGAVRFRLNLPITPDFVSWILYYGWRVEVVRPHELRGRAAEEHRRASRRYLGAAQRGKALEKMLSLNESYLMPLDGTGYFSSEKLFSPACLKRTSSSGKTTCYLQMLGAALVHPERKEVIPLIPEIISHQNGTEKNDCEINASKRFLIKFHNEHPHLRIVVTQDAISPNGPYIRFVKEPGYHLILTVKEADYAHLFARFDRAVKGKEALEMLDQKDPEKTHLFRWVNGLPINATHPDILVNVLEYWQLNDEGATKRFCWVTDIHLDERNVYLIMRAGRTRWRIENETFNTLKNQGYNFEHNYGPDEQDLSQVFVKPMMLSFLADRN